MTNLEKIKEIKKKLNAKWRYGPLLGMKLHTELGQDEISTLFRAYEVMRSIAIAETDSHIDVDKVFEERMKDAKGN